MLRYLNLSQNSINQTVLTGVTECRKLPIPLSPDGKNIYFPKGCDSKKTVDSFQNNNHMYDHNQKHSGSAQNEFDSGVCHKSDYMPVLRHLMKECENITGLR